MGAQISTPDNFSDSNIAELFSQVWQSRHLSAQDWERLTCTLTGSCLSGEERATIDRLRHAVRRGWVKVS